MSDKLSRAHRSWNMTQIRSRDTKPERIVRSLLHRLGYRFRLHRNDLPGRPDIVLSRRHRVILVHGCFWHQHRGCIDCSRPRSNTSYWTDKLRNNVRRDRKNELALKKLGWKVSTVWECETRDLKALSKRLMREIDVSSLSQRARRDLVLSDAEPLKRSTNRTRALRRRRWTNNRSRGGRV